MFCWKEPDKGKDTTGEAGGKKAAADAQKVQSEAKKHCRAIQVKHIL